MKPLRMAVLGAGLVGRRHIETIRALPAVAELVAVADPAADRTQFDLGGAAWFADGEEMLDQVKPEAVIIATPNNLACAARFAVLRARHPFPGRKAGDGDP